jgi:hypothetical protein
MCFSLKFRVKSCRHFRPMTAHIKRANTNIDTQGAQEYRKPSIYRRQR